MATKIGAFLGGIRDRWRRRDNDLGQRGEDIAARELERRGYRISERRWRCRLGEIDIVATDGDTLVIVEVKTRSRDDYGSPVDAVDRRKRKKLIQLAGAYVFARRIGDVNIRFDIVGVRLVGKKAARIELIRSAFDASDFDKPLSTWYI